MSKEMSIIDVLMEKNNLTLEQASDFVSKMFALVGEGLQKDRMVKIKGLGTFKMQRVSHRESVDVNTGERIIIEGRDKISFTPDTVVRDIVNAPFAQFETVMLNDGVDFTDIDSQYAEEASNMEEEDDSVVETSQPAVETSQSEDAVDETSQVEEEKVVIPSSVAEAPQVEAKKEETPQPIVAETSKAEEKKTEETANIDVPSNEKESNVSEEENAVCQSASSAVVTESIADDSDDNDGIADSDNSNKEDDLMEQLQKSHKRLRLLEIALACIILCGIGFAIYLGNSIMRQNNRQAHLEALLKEAQMKSAKKAVSKANVSQKEETYNVEPAQKVEVATTEKVSSKQAQTANPQLKQEEKPKAEAKPQPQTEAYAKYNADPRIRTGAYNIIGVSTIVKAKEGQTIESISRTYLGPGMECYLEALNGTSVKAGQNVKIPKLKHKKAK
jgi:nucleoid DNA-binding protein